jgi:hypothetical protein
MKEIATVYETENLEIFKTLAGNRDVKEKRKAKLIESIDKYGYITNPIIVNEKYEVIDGQGRLAACKELGVPISYIIVPNVGIKECQVFNMYGETWKVKDFIECYATRGSKDYQRILDLSGYGFGIRTYMFANGLYGGTPVSERIIREGRAVSSEETYQNAKEALEYLVTVKPFTDKVDGRKTDLESAVLFAYYDENCDNGRLSEALSKYYNTIGNIISITSALDELSKAYNRQLQKKARLYLREDFDRFRH